MKCPPCFISQLAFDDQFAIDLTILMANGNCILKFLIETAMSFLMRSNV